MKVVKAAEQTPGRRRRSEKKRTAILDAAEVLFVSEGFDRASVDAIAERAQVSKRTVYDHFGDKKALFDRVLARVGEALARDVRADIEDELVAGRELRDALIGFAERVVTQTLPSNSYLTFRRLDALSSETSVLDGGARHVPDRMLAERFAELARGGEIATDDPELAALQFSSLTILLVLNQFGDETIDVARDAERRRLIGAGVDMFLHAYAPAP